MRVAITGGGTGGHIYPALVVSQELSLGGVSIEYLGSQRGQEGSICKLQQIPFTAYESAPLYSLKSLRGWRSLIALLGATQRAKADLRSSPPDAIFSTGGYSAAPIMYAARSLSIPLVIHEANSVPGRSNRMFKTTAKAFTCVFEITKNLIPGAIRTGQPIRAELRNSSRIGESVDKNLILCLGGSQGSQFLNRLFPEAATIAKKNNFDYLLVAGKANFERLDKTSYPSSLAVAPYLETQEIVAAYSRAKVVVARSGGTVAELAMFGIPSVLIPLPSSADDHQLKNAEEFVALGGAKLLSEADATPKVLASLIDGWLENLSGYETARKALQDWDRPEAASQIADIVKNVASRSSKT